jgi:hypothetical protein
MPNTRPNIPLNDRVLSTLQTGVEVSCEPPGVHTHRLPVLLIHRDVGGRRPIASPTESFHPARDTSPQIGVSLMERPRIMVTSCNITVVSPDERWNVWVFRRHQSTSDVNAGLSIIGRTRLTSRASTRNLARCINGSYRSSHVRGLCVRILSGCKRCRTQQQYRNISPMRYNIITKSVKYIKPIDHTYRCLLHDETCSILVVPKGLKQREQGVPAHHLAVQQ